MFRHVTLALFILTTLQGLQAFYSNPPFYAEQYIGAGGARGLLLDEAGDLLVKCAFSNGGIVAVWEEEENGVMKAVRTDIADGQGLNLNHGLGYSEGYLYASSATTVYRWPYTPGQRKLITDPPVTVIRGIPNGGHTTRTLEFDAQKRMYVSCGSNSNVDQNSDRARIRRFNVDNLPDGGINFNDGEVFADGLRNEVGIAFDSRGVLWGVENGADNARRPDFPVQDIHNGNPCEEMNQFNGPVGQHYGYPYCFSSYSLEGYAKGTQFAWDSFMTDGLHNDEWCRNPANNKPPVMCMPAHQAPLGITFFNGEGCDSVKGSFPCSATGDAFVAFHGSWNSDTPVGYRTAWFPFDKATGLPTGEDIEILSDLRAVNAVFNKKGHLIISSDTLGDLIRVTYNSPA